MQLLDKQYSKQVELLVVDLETTVEIQWQQWRLSQHRAEHKRPHAVSNNNCPSEVTRSIHCTEPGVGQGLR